MVATPNGWAHEPEDVRERFRPADFVIAYENGELDTDEIVAGFQALIDNGLIPHLQGHYQRTARYFVRMGVCTAPRMAA